MKYVTISEALYADLVEIIYLRGVIAGGQMAQKADQLTKEELEEMRAKALAAARNEADKWLFFEQVNSETNLTLN